MPSELEVQMEVERMVIEEYALEQQQAEKSHVDILTVEQSNTGSRESTKQSKRKKKSRLETSVHILYCIFVAFSFFFNS